MVFGWVRVVILSRNLFARTLILSNIFSPSPQKKGRGEEKKKGACERRGGGQEKCEEKEK